MECKVKAWKEDNRIFLNVPFALRSKAKAIPGAKWRPHRKLWTFPFSYLTLKNIIDTFSSNVILDDELQKTLEEGDVYEKALKLKTAKNLPNPPICKGDDWLHQRRAFWWAKDLPAFLLDMWMGSGKTRVAINIIQNWHPNGNAKVLIACPSNVIPVWKEQIELHAAVPWNVVLLPAGTSIAKRRKIAEEAISNIKEGIITALVCNYEGVWRSTLGEFILKQYWDVVVADESHHLKAPGSKQSLFFAKLHKKSGRRICLSGTPLHDRPLDIYGQARFLVPEVFGTNFTKFRDKYAEMGGYGNYQILYYKNVDDFRNKYEYFTFSVGRNEVLTDLPPIIYTRRVCKLDDAENKVYKKLNDQLAVAVNDGTVTAGNVLSKIMKLQEITSGFIKDDTGSEIKIGESKKKLLIEVLEELPEDEPVVVFCRFTHDLDIVHEAAAEVGRKSYELSGRRRELDQWKRGSAGEVIAVQPKACSEGVSMHKARYIIDYSLSYSLGEYDQTRSRLQRPEQTRQVVSIALVAEGTIDESIYKAIEKKEEIIDFVINKYKTKGWL